MSAHVEIIATDLRRTKVKVAPGTYLVDVLREACQKLSLSSDKYLLKHKQKQIDLSGPFRTSGLSPGAKLELVAKSSSPSVINVALQFSGRDAASIPGGRLTGKFPSDMTLWKALRQFESGGASGGHNLNITARGLAQTGSGAASGSGQLYYESPVLNIMGRELASLEDLNKTLSQCGINSGSVLIRVSFRATDKTLYDAMRDISQYMNDVEPDGSTRQGEVASAPVPTTTAEEDKGDASTATPDATPTQGEQVQQEVEPTQATTPQNIETTATRSPQPAQPPTSNTNQEASGLADTLRPVGVFAAPARNTPAAALVRETDADFMPSVAHAQLHQARLLASAQNKRLKSDRELEADAAADAARVASVWSIAVKVRFPDGTSAQWQLGPDATGATLFRAVRSVMAHDAQPFRLVLPGGAGAVRDADGPAHGLVRAYGLRGGGVLLNLVWDEAASAAAKSQPFLRADVASQAREVVVPEVPAGEPDEDESRRPAAGSAGQKEKADGGGDGVAKKLPKWLKLPGKK